MPSADVETAFCVQVPVETSKTVESDTSTHASLSLAFQRSGFSMRLVLDPSLGEPQSQCRLLIIRFVSVTRDVQPRESCTIKCPGMLSINEQQGRNRFSAIAIAAIDRCFLVLISLGGGRMTKWRFPHCLCFRLRDSRTPKYMTMHPWQYL